MANKTLVAVFSASGVTKRVGKKIAEICGGDFFEIVPKEKYSISDLNWMSKKSRSSVEMNDPSARPEIAVKVPNMDDYDTVIIGFPIWYGAAPNVVNTFCSAYDWTGKKVHVFATSGGSGIGKTAEKLAPYLKGVESVDAKLVHNAEEL